MKGTLILKNGEVISLEPGSRLGALCVVSADRKEMVNIWELFTEQNLKKVEIKNGEGVVIGNYTDIILVSETSVVSSNGTVSTTFSLREKTEMEKRIDALEEEQEVQNDAIDDLGTVTSLIAGQMEEGGEQ